MRKLSILVFLFFLTAPCYARGDSSGKLFHAKILKCETNYASSAEFDKRWKITKGKAKMSFIFEGIDIAGQKARFIGNQGSADVSVLSTVDGIMFIEYTPGGIPQTSYVFDIQYNKGNYVFIHSRRTTMLGIAVSSQNYGFCKIHE